MGALPESQIKDFIGRLTGGEPPQSPVDQLLEMAQAAFEQGDLETAEGAWHHILSEEPENLTALSGIIQCRIRANDLETAHALFNGLDSDTRNANELAPAKAALQLADQAGDAGDVAELRAQVEANPDDHQARYDLSTALLGAGRREDAAAELIEIVRRDRSWNEDGARQQLLTLFDAWGPADPLTVATRKQLSRLLFS